MPPALATALHDLARTFIDGVLKTVLSAPLDDILSAPASLKGEGPGASRRGATSGRLKRRSPEEIAAAADKIVSYVKKHPKGVHAGAIKAALGIDKREWNFPLARALKSKALKKKGRKRATVYFAR
jgi:hypothetical protein